MSIDITCSQGHKALLMNFVTATKGVYRCPECGDSFDTRKNYDTAAVRRIMTERASLAAAPRAPHIATSQETNHPIIEAHYEV